MALALCMHCWRFTIVGHMYTIVRGRYASVGDLSHWLLDNVGLDILFD